VVLADSPLGSLDEIHYLPGLGEQVFGLQLSQSVTQVQFSQVNPAKNVLDRTAGLGAETCASQAYRIDSRNKVARDAMGDKKRRQIFADRAQARHHRKPPDFAELVHHGVAAEKGTVADGDITTQQHTIGKYHPVAKGTVVRHVAVAHEKTAVADDCPGIVLGTAMDGNAFTYDAVVPDCDRTDVVGIKLQVLGKIADYRPGVNSGVGTDAAVGIDGNMALEHAAGTDTGIGLHVAKRADGYIVSYFCSIFDDGGWVYIWHGGSCLSA